jgi:hypothetical protein
MEFLRRRREFVAVPGGAAVAWPLAAHAHQARKNPKLGVLHLRRD